MPIWLTDAPVVKDIKARIERTRTTQPGDLPIHDISFIEERVSRNISGIFPIGSATRFLFPDFWRNFATLGIH
ncbi:MAG: hypothetical protein ACRBCJ_09695 [Hyphomicrobiaceae bacterium]